MLDDVFLTHMHTKTDLSLEHKPVLAEAGYSSAMDGTTRGQRIKEARKHWQSQGAAGERTTKMLVKLLNVSEPTYYNWEGDKTKELMAGNLMKLSKVTGFHPNYLAHGRPPKMLADDEAAAALVARTSDFSAEEYAKVFEYVDLVLAGRSVRKKAP